MAQLRTLRADGDGAPSTVSNLAFTNVVDKRILP